MAWRGARPVTQFPPKPKAGGNSARIWVVGALLALAVGAFLMGRSPVDSPPAAPEKSAARPAVREDVAAREKAARVEEMARLPADPGRGESKDDAPGRSPGGGPPKGDPLTVRAGKFSRTDTVIGVLLAHGLRYSEIQRILATRKGGRVFSRVRAGRRYAVKKRGEEFHEFILHLNGERRLRVSRTPSGGLKAEEEPIPYVVDVARIQSRIDHSLHRAISDGGGAPVLAGRLGDIFAYVVDFHKDLQSGDELKMLVERRYLGDEFVGYGKILAAELTVRGMRHAAVYFDHKGGRYYNFRGESLKRAFLRSPLRYTRVSSRFARRRLHPVLKRYRPHLGVDYAAPRGTPVHAVADGVVTWAGRKGPAGKMVKLRHGGGYRTAYLHLYRYARGIRKGRKVVQGQLIGYVGSTGLSTGPHLDYRITRRGRYLDPLKAKLPKGMPLPRALRPAFQRVLDERRAMLDSLSPPKESASSPGGARRPLSGAAQGRESQSS